MHNSTRSKSNSATKGEMNFKKDFCLKYFGKSNWQLDVLNEVDILLQDKTGRSILYIESKDHITNDAGFRKAITQVILTNKKQEAILPRVALIYRDKQENDVLQLIDCSDNSVMFNNDINWAKERASNPTRDAIDRINDRLKGRITTYRNEEIRDVYQLLMLGEETAINITEKNVNVVYESWRNEVKFVEGVKNEQDLINLFLVDILNGTEYKVPVYEWVSENDLFGKKVKEKRVQVGEEAVKFEGTTLSRYKMIFENNEILGILYRSFQVSPFYTIADHDSYHAFWRRYHRPPEVNEFFKIIEHSARLYSEQYRRDTGGEYTPSCFVQKQNEILAQHYNLDEYIVCDPCAGVGNLENQFGKDYKQYCYLSTLEQMDVDTCKIKGFENAIQYDYLKDDKQPLWKYKGLELDIREICKREGRKLMIVMNPPYQRKAGFKNDLAIEFFLKVCKLEPDVIVYYCKTEFFLRPNTVSNYVNSGYKIVSHIFSNAKETFKLSEWALSQVIFDKENGETLTGEYIKTERYELNKKTQILDYVRSYTFDNIRPQLIDEIEESIKKNSTGLILGQWTNQNYCLVLSNRQTSKRYITTNNLQFTLLLKGINFNTHGKYFETSNLTYRGTCDEISQELFNDAIMFSQFYKGILFTNKGERNYVMPFTAEELGCAKNDLNVLFAEHDLFSGQIEQFDFREWFHQFDFSPEAKDLYDAALEVFRYYHRSKDYQDRDYNDSFYDITNAIMGKDVTSFQELESDDDRRITRVKTTKGTRGFGRNTIRYVIGSKDLPIFERFFDARDTLARKINRQLVEQHLLLWERENIY